MLLAKDSKGLYGNPPAPSVVPKARKSDPQFLSYSVGNSVKSDHLFCAVEQPRVAEELRTGFYPSIEGRSTELPMH